MTRIRKTAECARVFLHPEGRFFEVGEVMRLPDYARTLERLARGGAGVAYAWQPGLDRA